MMITVLFVEHNNVM